MILLRKHLPIIMTLLLICLLWPGIVLASEADWQIKWQDNGTLQEKVTVTGTQAVSNDTSWTSQSTENGVILKREVKDWNNYKQLQERLPLDVQQSNYIVVGITEIMLDKQSTSTPLLAQLNSLDKMTVKISVPGIVISSSGKRLDDFSSQWNLTNSSGWLAGNSILKVITFDGFLLGIVIVALGLVIVLILFTARLRKVDRFIAEEYSLDNIHLDDLEDDQSSEDKSAKDTELNDRTNNLDK